MHENILIQKTKSIKIETKYNELNICHKYYISCEYKYK
jgi:hypothetical protein